MMERSKMATMEFKVAGSFGAAADPGSGNMAFNTPAQGDATQLYFSQFDVGSVDVSEIFGAMAPGTALDFVQSNDSTVTGSFTVNAVVDKGGWYAVDVTAGASSGLPFAGSPNATFTVTPAVVTEPDVTRWQYYCELMPVGADPQFVLGRLNLIGSYGWELMFFGGYRSGEEARIGWFKGNDKAVVPPA